MSSPTDKVKNNLLNGDTLRAIQTFCEIVESSPYSRSNEKTKEQLMLLKAELSRVDKQCNLGTISNDEKDIKYAKGNKLILTLLNQYTNPTNDKEREINIITIKSFGIIAFITLGIVLMFGSYFYMPREQSSVPFILHILYSIIFISSISIVSFYTYVNFGKNLRFIRTIIIAVIMSTLFFFAPYISTIYIQNNSKQITANDRFLDGRWEDAIFIYIGENHKLTKKSKSNIIEMKRLLNQAGYYIFEINETPDFRVITSLKKLQSDFDLNQDGFLGRATKNVLFGIIYKKELNIDGNNMKTNDLTIKIQKFQRNNKLYDDGVIGDKTLQLLKAKYKMNISTGVDTLLQ